MKYLFSYRIRFYPGNGVKFQNMKIIIKRTFQIMVTKSNVKQ